MSTALEGVLNRKRVDACDEAEQRFKDCASQIASKKSQGQGRIKVYHGADKIPFAIGKSFRVPSVLTLLPVSLTGSEKPTTPLPEDASEVHEGSISAFGPDMVVRRTGHRLIDNRWFLSTMLVEGPLSIRPMRLSQWAPRDASPNPSYVMSGYKPMQAEHDDNRGAVFAGLTLNDFRVVAAQAMVMCGVA
jgi:hypothetical protein